MTTTRTRKTRAATVDAMGWQRDGMRVSRHFDTFTDFADAADSPLPADYTGTPTSRTTAWRRIEWMGGTATFASAMDLARKGWSAGRARIERIADTMSANIVGSLVARERMEPAVYGTLLDVDAYLRGEPEPFYMVEPDLEQTQIGGPIVRILANMTQSAGISASVYTTRGAALAALAECLERIGRRVEIVAAFSTFRGGLTGARITVTVTVKRPEEAMQLDQIAYAVAHASSFRRLGFAIFERAPKDVREAVGCHETGGYGMVAPMDGAGYDVMLPGAEYGAREWSSEAAAAAWVRGALAAQGVKIETA